MERYSPKTESRTCSKGAHRREKITSVSVTAAAIRQDGPKAVHSEGAFLARQENTTFHTFGVRLNEGSPNALSDDEVLAIMNDFIKRPDVLAAAGRHREASQIR